MPDLLLHIGHGKTGSSYLQNLFRIHRARLAAEGIAYPPRGESGQETETTLTVGNAQRVLESEAELTAALEGYRPGAGQHLLLSSEMLFFDIEAHADLGFLPRTAGDFGFDRVRVLFFIREPLAHAASEWQQQVKRGLEWRTLEDFYRNFPGPESSERVLDRLEAAGGIEITVRNYSRCSKRLVEVVTDWLGVPAETLPPLPVRRVNRSLTVAELALMREVNRVVGMYTHFLTRALCERLPEFRADDVRPSVELQQATLDRLWPAMRRVNARLPESERYQGDLGPACPIPDEATFSADQIAAIAEGLGGEIVRLRREIGRIHARPHEVLSIRKMVTAAFRRSFDRLRPQGGFVNRGPQAQGR